MEYLKLFNKHNQYLSYIDGKDEVKNNVSYCEDNKHVHYEIAFINDYFTTKALANGTISFTIHKMVGTQYLESISYSTNNGFSWTKTLNEDNKEGHLTITVNVNEGDEILWKGSGTQVTFSAFTSHFSSTMDFEVKGNILSLIYGNAFRAKRTLTNVDSIGHFAGLFEDCTGLINAKDLTLPLKAVSNSCYAGMFKGCSALVTAPNILPATTLNWGCYQSMFYGCALLTTVPQLPATTLADECYRYMFYGCTSLTTAPQLPATTLANNCYTHMFQSCTSLVNAPQLPATTLTNGCYAGMFLGCTALEAAPVLPARTLVSGCYNGMFQNCSSLNYIKAMFTTTPSDTYTQSWVSGVYWQGTFVKNSAATWNVYGDNGVPSGQGRMWTVETADE